jgi:DNA-binding response OmpR family regulator
MPKILVVDDEIDMVNLIKFRLEVEGWEVVTAANGHSAMASAIQEHPDLILLDIMMPDMDGITVLEQIRTKRGIHRTPVVMVTAKRSVIDMEKARRMDAPYFIVKPFDPEVLITTARKALKMH